MWGPIGRPCSQIGMEKRVRQYTVQINEDGMRLDEFLSYTDDPPVMNEERKAAIEKDRKELSGNFCRSCGYCMPCTVGIQIPNAARMIQLIRRMPSAAQMTTEMQAEMEKIEDCVECGVCMTRCPYELPIPKLLRENLEDYRKIISGEIDILNYN